jgi:hypothetical protein
MMRIISLHSKMHGSHIYICFSYLKVSYDLIYIHTQTFAYIYIYAALVSKKLKGNESVYKYPMTF